ASLLVYLRRRRVDSGRASLAYAVSLLLFVLSLLSKGAAMTLPAALVLGEWARGRRLDRRFWLGLVPYVVLGVLGGVGLIQVKATVPVPPLGDRLLIACRAFWFYLATFFWPHALQPIYPRWSPTWTDPVDVLAVLGVVALAALAWAARARLPRVIVFGAGVFV